MYASIIFTFKTHTYLYGHLYFYERFIYELSLERSVLICTHFSLNELHFRYNEQLTVVRQAIFPCKVAVISLSIHEFWPYEQFSRNELPS